MTIVKSDMFSGPPATIEQVARGLEALTKEFRKVDSEKLNTACDFLDEVANIIRSQDRQLRTAHDVLSLDPKPNLAAGRVYDDALGKLKWNLERGKDDRADYWSILAASLEELYGVKRPKHLQENL